MVARIFLFLITTTVAKHHHSNLGQNNDFFTSVYTAIHSVVNDLFESIDLDTNFMNQSNTISLLTMHQDLKNIVDIAIEAYNVIQNITSDKNNQSQFIYSLNKTVVDVTELDTMVNEILNKKNFDVYRIIKGTKHKHAKGKRNNKDESNIKNKETKENIKPAFENSEEFKEFVINFLSKVNNLTINDFKKSGNIYNYDRFAVPSKKNLKAWDAPSSLIFELEENDTRRIFRGSKTRVKSFPFMVSIHIMGEFTCSGCIISRDFVITAASCLGIAYTNDFVEKNLKSIYVRLASDHTTSGGETIPVENLYFHPQFNAKNLQNNLAIIRMEKRVRFSRKQKKIRRILWDHTPGVLPNETKQILILGWGPSKKGQVTQKQPKLRVSMLDVHNTTDCRKKYTENYITKENFCAAYNGTNGSACNGDVGGPGLVGGILMGVVSFGAPECGAAGNPTVFTKLGYYVPWIESVMNAHKKRNQSNYDSINTRRKNKHSNKKRLKENKATNDKLLGAHNDYPQEKLAVRQALLEVINDDQSLVHDVLYGDLYDEFSQFFKPKPETDLKKNSIRTKKQKTNQFKPKEEKDLKKNTMPTKKQSTNQPTIRDLKFDLESDSEHNATTEIAILSTSLIIMKGDSDYETDNDSVQKESSDNYEESSEEECGLSIEISTSTTKKSLENKEDTHSASWLSNSESKSDRQVSDESTDYSKEIKEFFEKTRDKSKNKKYSKKSRDTVDSTRSILRNSREKRTREVLIKHEHFSKQARSVLDEGKSFATKTFIIEFEPTDVQVNKDKPKLKNSESERNSSKDIMKPDKKISQSFYLQF